MNHALHVPHISEELQCCGHFHLHFLEMFKILKSEWSTNVLLFSIQSYSHYSFVVQIFRNLFIYKVFYRQMYCFCQNIIRKFCPHLIYLSTLWSI
jgi:hypothetical protein